MADTASQSTVGLCPVCGRVYPPEVSRCGRDQATIVVTQTGDKRIGELFSGRYRLLRRLGSGGMGAVYEALELDSRRTVAIKVVHRRKQDRKDVERLRMEARAVRLIDHPNVVRFFDFGHHDGMPFIVMEHLVGRSLRQWVKAGEIPLSWQRAAWVVMQAAQGVSAAHQKGLVHRDLKPGNVMVLTEKDSRGRDRVKVLDFGLVAGPGRLDDRLTVTGVVLGTPHYIAPEMCEHPPEVKPAADVYALGVLLYQLVVGHRPFEGESFFAVIDSHLHKPIPKPTHTDKNQPVPPVLRRIWTRALSKDPRQRFQNGHALALALHEALSGAARRTLTRPPSAALTPHRVTTLSVALVDAGADASGQLLPLVATRPVLDRVRGLVEAAAGQLEPGPEGTVRALFGVPEARDTDAAVALEVAAECWRIATQRLGPDAVAVGLHTRHIAVAPGGDRAGGRLRPLVEPFEVAAAVARVGRAQGGVALSGSTYRTLQRHLPQPIPATAHVAGEAVHLSRGQVASRGTVRRSHVRAAQMVGRSAELGKLLGWVSDAVTDRRGGVRMVSSAPGLGKSRLCGELGRAAARRHPGLQVLEAHPEGQATQKPFAVFERFLADAVGFGSAAARAERVVHWVTAAVAPHGDPDAQEDAWAILRLVGLAASDPRVAAAPQAARQRAFSAFASLFRSVAADGGALLLIDDAHHADSGSLDLAEFLARELAEFPFCIVLFCRRGAAVEARFGPPLTLAPLILAPLSAEASGILVDALVSPGTLEGPRRAQIVARADGNPFFIEELVRAARDGLADDGSLPESIFEVVTARLSALTEQARTVLCAAAVVGREFWTGAVVAQAPVTGGERRVERVLAGLAAAGFVVPMKQSRVQGETQWRFANQLTAAATYRMLDDGPRAAGHSAVARWLGARAADASIAPHALIAPHLEAAGALDRAAVAWRRAGDAARSRYANREAADAYQKALALPADWPAEVRVAMALELGILRHLLGQKPEARRGLEWVAKAAAASATQRCRAQRQLARMEAWEGHVSGQQRILKRAVNGSANASLEERLMVASDLAYSMIRAGDSNVAEALLENAIQTAYAADNLGDLLLPLAQLHQSRALLERNRGRLAAAEQDARASIDLFEQLGYMAGVATTLTSLSVTLRELRRFDDAAEAATRAAGYFREWGYRVHELTALINLGWSRLDAGRPEVARHLLARVRREFETEVTETEAVLLDAGEALAALALGETTAAEHWAALGLGAAAKSALLEVSGWAQFAAGCVRADDVLLEASTQCWRRLNRPAWLARTLEARARICGGPRAADWTAEVSRLRAEMGLAPSSAIG